MSIQEQVKGDSVQLAEIAMVQASSFEGCQHARTFMVCFNAPELRLKNRVSKNGVQRMLTKTLRFISLGLESNYQNLTYPNFVLELIGVKFTYRSSFCV